MDLDGKVVVGKESRLSLEDSKWRIVDGAYARIKEDNSKKLFDKLVFSRSCERSLVFSIKKTNIQDDITIFPK